MGDWAENDRAFRGSDALNGRPQPNRKVGTPKPATRHIRSKQDAIDYINEPGITQAQRNERKSRMFTRLYGSDAAAVKTTFDGTIPPEPTFDDRLRTAIANRVPKPIIVALQTLNFADLNEVWLWLDGEPEAAYYMIQIVGRRDGQQWTEENYREMLSSVLINGEPAGSFCSLPKK